MGAFLDKPNTEKHNEDGSGNGLRFGLTSMQGWRVEMEDAHCAHISLPGALTDWSFFAVFDGHAGARVAAVAAEQLLTSILANDDFKSVSEVIPSLENVRNGIRTGFLNLDDKIRTLPEITSGEDKSGTTAVCVMVSKEHLVFANCGDSRAVMCRSGKLAFNTEDHKPVNPAEKARIQNAGGSVIIQRVNGSLAVSRALGDYEYKCVEGRGQCEQLVSPEPEISIVERSPEDQFIVLACDGIWDVMSNDDVCAFVLSRMKLTEDIKSISDQLVDTCLYKGSRDNMSVVIVALPGAPPCSEIALAEELKIDADLESRVRGFFEGKPSEITSSLDVPYIMHQLSLEDIPNLPPGGGLFAKRYLIAKLVEELRPVVADSPEPAKPGGKDNTGSANRVEDILPSMSVISDLTARLQGTARGPDAAESSGDDESMDSGVDGDLGSSGTSSKAGAQAATSTSSSSSSSKTTSSTHSTAAPENTDDAKYAEDKVNKKPSLNPESTDSSAAAGDSSPKEGGKSSTSTTASTAAANNISPQPTVVT